MTESTSVNNVLRIAALADNTMSEGPNTRFALWVQGCSIRCPGCCNPEMQNPDDGYTMNITELEQRIMASPGIEGVTFLGGEPFDQAYPLGLLASRLQSKGLGVITFSGYRLDELQQKDDAVTLLAASDLLIDGPFILQYLSIHRRYIGSENQRFHFFSDRYRNHPDFRRPGQAFHMHFEEDELTISGFPDFFPNINRKEIHNHEGLEIFNPLDNKTETNREKYNDNRTTSRFHSGRA